MITSPQYMHHCLVMAITIGGREYKSVEEALFYNQLLRTLTQYNKLEEISLEMNRMAAEDILYEQPPKDNRNPGDDPPDSTGATESG